jgi:gamma-glutamylcyclotransferase (GGCT)/AIG2-like uncharacterized protein YtfP
MNRVFVYGTLKSGFRNNRLIAGCKFQPAIAEGIELHDGPGYPYAKKGTGIIYGELYEVSKEVMKRLDMLEGHPRHYERTKVNVFADGQDVEAWIYLSKFADKYPVIESGKWQ